MLLNLGLFSLILLVLLLPQAQSSRARFFTPHPQHHTRGHHHAQSSPLKASKPHIQMVTGSNEKQVRNADGDIAMVTVSVHHQAQELGGMLDTPVSGPNPGGNSEILAVSGLGNMLDTPVSGPNPGGNSNTLGSMLATPSGPNPGGNSQVLNESAIAKSFTNMLDTPVSGPNPGGNSQVLNVSAIAKSFTNIDGMLDTPVSGPNPGGNSATLGNMLDTPVSGPNPGANAHILAASSGPNPGGDSGILAASSGPNPGGNSGILAASSGPNPGGNSKSLTSSDAHVFSGDAGRLFSANVAPIGERDIVILSAVSGPNPGGNSATLTSRKFDVSKKASSKKFAQSGTYAGSNMSEKAETWHAEGTIFSELPRAPVPPSGPSPTHDTVVTNQGLFAERKLRGVIGCEQEGEGASASGGRFHHLEAYTNTINSMGASSLTSS